MKDQKSTFNMALRTQGGKVLYMKKQKAYDNCSYIPSEYEINYGMRGSIYCKNLSIYEDGEISKGSFWFFCGGDAK